ncbi:MAG: DUF1302 family protein [Sedimenticola sp.]
MIKLSHRSITLLMLLACYSTPTLSADVELNDVLEGFDEDPVATTEIDQVMEGFEEETANDEHGVAEALEGFDEEPAPAESTTTAITTSPWQLSGAVTLSSAFNYAHQQVSAGNSDYRGLSRLRTKLSLELDYALNSNWKLHGDGTIARDFIYQLRDSTYSPQTLNSHQQEGDLGELFVQGGFNRDIDLKIGRQTVIWGKSDNLRVNDVINPLDSRQMGMVDIEDLRLPLTMTRLDWYRGDWSLTALAIHEVRFNKSAPYGSDYYPFTSLQPAEVIPTGRGDNTEYALALNGIFSGWDIAFYGARLFDDQPHMETHSGITKRYHSRITMAGAAINAATGNWLFKGEVAHFRGMEYSSLVGEQRSRSDLLLGVEYSGLKDASLSFEIVNRHVHDYASLLAGDGVKEDELQTAIRYQGDYLHNRLHFTLLNSLNNWGDGGGFSRAALAYDLADALTFTGGVITYHSGDKIPFNAIGDNDRVFVDLKYSF